MKMMQEQNNRNKSEHQKLKQDIIKFFIAVFIDHD